MGEKEGGGLGMVLKNVFYLYSKKSAWAVMHRNVSLFKEIPILHILKWLLPQKYTSKTVSMSFLAWKEKEPKYIYMDRNCH